MTNTKAIELRLKVARERLKFCMLEESVPETSASCFDRSLNDIADLLAENDRLGAVVEAAQVVVDTIDLDKTSGWGEVVDRLSQALDNLKAAK